MSSKKGSNSLFNLPNTAKNWISNKFISFYKNTFGILKYNSMVKSNISLLAEDMKFVFDGNNKDMFEVVILTVKSKHFKKEFLKLIHSGMDVRGFFSDDGNNKLDLAAISLRNAKNEFYYKSFILFLELFLDIRKKHFPSIKIPNKDVSPKESSDLYYEYVTYILISFYLIKTFIDVVQGNIKGGQTKDNLNVMDKKSFITKMFLFNIENIYRLISDTYRTSNSSVLGKGLMSTGYIMVNLIAESNKHLINFIYNLSYHANWSRLCKSYYLSMNTIENNSKSCHIYSCHNEYIDSSFLFLKQNTIYNNELSPEKRIVKWITYFLRDNISDWNSLIVNSMNPMLITGLVQANLRIDKLEKSLKKRSSRKKKSTLKKRKIN